MPRTHELPTPGEFPALVARQLDWSELDVLGHANNARYFTWFEEARMRYFQGVGIPVDDGLGWGPILAHTECNFLAPVTWPASLLLGARTRSVGRSSLKMEYAVFVEGDEGAQCVATGGRGGRPAPL